MTGAHRARVWAPVSVALIAAGTLVGGAPPQAAQPRDVTLSLDLVPQQIVNDQPIQVIATIDSPNELAGATLELTPPPGFRFDQASFTLPTFSRRLVQSAILRPQAPGPSGERPIVARLMTKASTGSTVAHASQIAKLAFVAEISLAVYLGVATIGVGLGYLLRLLIKVLTTVQPPPAAPVAGGEAATGPITRFVQRHYYWVDFLVTVGLGVVVLVWLSHDGRPPQTVAVWPKALATGVGLGLLTNSELLTKLR